MVDNRRVISSPVMAGLMAALGGVAGAVATIVLLHHGTKNVGLLAAVDLVALAGVLGPAFTRQRRNNRWQRILDRALACDEQASMARRGGASLDARLHHYAEAARELGGADQAVLYAADREGELVVLTASPSLDGVEPGTRLPAAGVLGEAMSAQRPVTDADTPGEDGEAAWASVAACPLVVDGKTTAVVLVRARRSRAFGGRRLRRLVRAVGQEAAAIERLRLDDAERRSRLGAEHARRHVALLAAGSGVLASALDEYDTTLEGLAQVVIPEYADWLAIDLLSEDGTPNRVVVAPAENTLDDLDVRHPLWRETVEQVIRTQESVLVPDLDAGRADQATIESDYSDLCQEVGLNSWAIVPIRSRGRSWGALTVGTRAPRRGLRASDVAAFEELASRSALAIDRVVLYRETRKAAEAARRNAGQLASAVETARLIIDTLSVPEVLNRAVRGVADTVGAEHAVITLISGDDRTRSVAWPPGLDDTDTARRELDPSPNGGAPGEPSESRIAIALTVPDGTSRGSLVVSGPPGRAFSNEDAALLLLLGQVTSAAIEHAELLEAATASEQRLRALVESSPLAIIELSAVGSPRVWNGAADDLFRWGPADPPSLDPETAALLWSLRNRLLANEQVIDERLTIRRSDGSAVEVSVAAATVAHGDDPQGGLLCVLTDVTQRQLLEREVQQKRRMEALGLLAGGVAHDFNNLLTLIVGYSDLLAKKLGPADPLYSDVDAIRSAGQRAATLTEQLLTISRRRVVQPSVVELNTVVTELNGILERIIGEHIALRVDLNPDAGRVRIDGGQLEQVVLNLVVNARDAMAGGGTLTITTRAEPDDEADRSWAVLMVSDTGIGMDAATVERCFEPFFTTRRRDGGTGLGLATVYGIVTEAGGAVSVDSAPGQGARIRVALPTIVDEAVIAPEPVEPAEEANHDGTLLLVEDEPAVREYARGVLSAAGYSVHEAPDGRAALALARALEPPCDILVTDVVMPGMSGPDLAFRLRVNQPDLAVLFISGYADEPEGRLGNLPPNSGFLPKPFRPDQLRHAVSQVLAQAAEEPPVDQGSKR